MMVLDPAAVGLRAANRSAPCAALRTGDVYADRSGFGGQWDPRGAVFVHHALTPPVARTCTGRVCQTRHTTKNYRGLAPYPVTHNPCRCPSPAFSLDPPPFLAMRRIAALLAALLLPRAARAPAPPPVCDHATDRTLCASRGCAARYAWCELCGRCLPLALVVVKDEL